MTKEEYINLYNDKSKRYIHYIITNKELSEKIEIWNKDLNCKSLPQKCYNYFFGITEIPKCKGCGTEEVTYGGNKRFGYADFCGSKCVAQNKEISNRRVIKRKERGNRSSDVLKRNIETLSIESNYEIIDIVELKNFLVSFTKNADIANFQKILIKHHKNYYCNLINLPEFDISKFNESLYFFLSGPSYCEECGKKITSFKNFKDGYYNFCSFSCSAHNIFKKKRNKDRTERYEKYLKDISKRRGFVVISEKEHYIQTGEFEIIHVECGAKFVVSHMSNRTHFTCPNEQCKGYSESECEIEIGEFLNHHSINFKKGDRKILSGKEIDLYVPEHNIGIEYNGTYWHSELLGKDRYYHLNKTTLAQKQDILLLHIFDSEWNNKKDIIKSLILSKMNKCENIIYGRKCIIKILDNKTKNEFLVNNHLQGKDKSKFMYGLYYKDELVSVMTFGKRKITGGKSKLELIRFCNKINTRVIGGASKLLKHFIDQHNPEEIITYSDRRYSNGKFYNKLGFQLSHVSSPNYWYFHKGDSSSLFHRSNFMKHKLINKLESFDPSKTEWENMIDNGYNRIWDCGNFVYKLKLT